LNTMRGIIILLLLGLCAFVVCVSAMENEEEHVFAVELQISANAEEIAEMHGFENLGQVGTLENHFLFKLKPHLREAVEDSAKALGQNNQVVWLEKQVRKARSKRPQF